MNTNKRIVVAVVAVGLLLLGSSPLWAQPPAVRAAQLTQAQFLQNLLATQQALQPIVPPAFNPGFAPGGFINPYTPSLGGGFVNPYTPGGGAGLGNASPYGGLGGYPYTFIPPEGYF